MEIFEQDERYMDEADYASDPFSMLKGAGLFFGLFLAPAIVIGVLIFVVFMRTLKWKPHVTAAMLAIILSVVLLFAPGQLQNLALFLDFGKVEQKSGFCF